jgi:hypothetical protein
MAITLVSNSVDDYGFLVNGNSADLSSCEELVSAVAGKSIYVERVVISFGAAINISIGEGETTGSITTTRIGPIYGAQNSTVEVSFNRPLKLTANTSLTTDSSGAGAVTITATGFIK